MKALSDYVDRQLKAPKFAEAWFGGEDEYQDQRVLGLSQTEDEPVPQGLHEAFLASKKMSAPPNDRRAHGSRVIDCH